jgi:hypothetical protein
VQMQVIVPPGVFAGQQMQVAAPGGVQVAVTVPQGVSPGTCAGASLVRTCCVCVNAPAVYV